MSSNTDEPQLFYIEPDVYEVLTSPYKIPFWTRVKRKIMFWRKKKALLYRIANPLSNPDIIYETEATK